MGNEPARCGGCRHIMRKGVCSTYCSEKCQTIANKRRAAQKKAFLAFRKAQDALKGKKGSQVRPGRKLALNAHAKAMVANCD